MYRSRLGVPCSLQTAHNVLLAFFVHCHLRIRNRCEFSHVAGDNYEWHYYFHRQYHYRGLLPALESSPCHSGLASFFACKASTADKRGLLPSSFLMVLAILSRLQPALALNA